MTSSSSGCWQCIKSAFAKPFKSSSYKVRKTHSDPLEVEFSHRPQFNPHSPSSQSQSYTAGRADRYSAGLATNVSSTSSFDAASYEQEYEASMKRTEFMFYCGCDTPKSENGREGGGAFSFSSSTAPSEYSEDEEHTSEQRASQVATPKISHHIPVFFSPRNAVPMLPRPKPREKPRPMRMASTRAPSFINVNPVKGRGTDAL
ncbi:hypothetical protein Gpo141_00009090 [Globisporangium polare]